MLRKRQTLIVAGVAAAALAASAIVPALRRSRAQDAAPGAAQPAILERSNARRCRRRRQLQRRRRRLAQAAPDAAPTNPAGPPQPDATADAPPAPGAGETVSEERFQLRTLTVDTLRARIEKIFGRPPSLLAADGSVWTRFTVQTGDDAPVLIAVQPQTGEVRLLGRPDQLRAWRELLAAIDAPPAADRSTEVIAADETAAPQIRRTVDLLLAQAQVPAEPGTVQGPLPGIPEGLLGPVEIVNIEGTDLFIIQGNPRDVERALQVIEQIQEMSRVSEPQIVVRPLANIDSQAIAALLTQLFAPTAEEGSFSLTAYYGRLLAAAARPAQRRCS